MVVPVSLFWWSHNYIHVYSILWSLPSSESVVCANRIFALFWPSQQTLFEVLHCFLWVLSSLSCWNGCACVYKMKKVRCFLLPGQTVWFLLGNESHDCSKGCQLTTLLPPWMLSFQIGVFQAFVSRHLCERNVWDVRFECFFHGKQCQVLFLHSDLESPFFNAGQVYPTVLLQWRLIAWTTYSVCKLRSTLLGLTIATGPTNRCVLWSGGASHAAWLSVICVHACSRIFVLCTLPRM